MEVNRIEDKRSENKKSLKEKLKRIKHLDIFIALVIVIVALIIYFGGFAKKNEVVKINDDDKQLICDIEKTLSSIDGIGKTKVVINYDENSEIKYLTKEQSVTKVDKDGSISVIESSKDPIIIRDSKGDKPIMASKKENQIKGVIVVCKGGGDIKNKLKIMDALSTLLEVDSSKIRVYEMR